MWAPRCPRPTTSGIGNRPTGNARFVRIDGYLPIGDYALIGDGHTSALVGRDGAIDWLCVPRVDSPPVLDRILDGRDGGCFELQPDGPFEAVRRYRTHTNVLETTFTTSSGSVRVTDAMTLGDERELVRAVDPIDGRVRMRWRYAPRRDEGLQLQSWDAGEGFFELLSGYRATFVLSHGSPTRTGAEQRLERTSASWMDWASRAEYDGRWREPVLRSALVLKLLAYEPTGAIARHRRRRCPSGSEATATGTTASAGSATVIYTMRALLLLGYRKEAEAFFRWQLEAI